jgi:hypothetical protein
VKQLRSLLLCSVLVYAGCSGVLRELREDPAIVGGTFTGVKLSLTAVPGLPIPVPEVIIGRGTFYRIGGDRTVEVMAGDAVGTAFDPAEQKLNGVKVNSEASMAIRAGEVKPPTRATP